MTLYTPEFEATITTWAKEYQSEKRFAHTARVVETVTTLAQKWSPEDVMICRLSAWIHDSAKRQDDEALLAYALSHGVEVRQFEREIPMLLHGVVAYLMASEAFQFADDQIRSACAYHTTGHPDMNLVDKLLYLADVAEPARDFPSVKAIRELMLQDVDKAILMTTSRSIQYLIETKKTIDPNVVELYNKLIISHEAG